VSVGSAPPCSKDFIQADRFVLKTRKVKGVMTEEICQGLPLWGGKERKATLLLPSDYSQFGWNTYGCHKVCGFIPCVCTERHILLSQLYYCWNVLICPLIVISFEMLCWRRMEKVSWTDHVRNEEVLLRVKEQRNILHEIRKRKANWIGQILRRNCLLQWVTEGKIQGG